MIEIARLSLDTDLQAFSAWLSKEGVLHRVVETEGQQSLLIQNEQIAEQVRAALQTYLENPDIREALAQYSDAMPPIQTRRIALYDRVTPSEAPFVFVVLAVCLLAAWLTNLGQGGPLLRAMLVVNPFDIDSSMQSIPDRWDALVATLQLGHWWRLLTPDFLHFSFLHITFNLLMFWILGGQLEKRRGSFALVTLFVLVSIVSNVAQLLDGGYLFGGLSGVVYGLFGYCWVWSRFDSRVFMPDALFRFALIWLVIGYTPLTEWVGLGRMANSAHLYGLLSGLIWAWIVFALGSKRPSES